MIYRNILVFCFVLLSMSTMAQDLPTVYAYGGEGRNVNWSAIEAEHDRMYGDNSPGFFVPLCRRDVEILSASSTLADQGAYNYSHNNLHGNPYTAWVEGEDGYGIGTYIYVRGNINTIYNGYQRSPQSWVMNSRVKKFKVYKNGEPLCYLVLTDEMGRQSFNLPGYEDQDEHDVFRLEIIEAYPGSKWADVAITAIMGIACCFSSNTAITSSLSSYPMHTVAEGLPVTTIDLETGSVTETSTKLVTQQHHLSLITVRCGDYEVQLTPDHPLYVKGVGFTSLPSYARTLGLASYQELTGTAEIMVWDEESQETQFKTIDAITLNKGYIDTYTILGLKEGNTYIANGFITKTY